MLQIALKMLIGDKTKYYGLIFGIVFATFLMSQQVALFIGAMARTASVVTDVHEADIWVMHPEVNYIDELKGIRDIDLYRVRSVRGIKWAVPFFKGAGIIRAPHGVFKQAILLGVDDATLIGKPPKIILGNWLDLKQPNSMIIDKAGWNLLWPKEPFQLGRIVEINDYRMVIVGICDTSAPFLTFPVVFTRYSTALRLVPHERDSLTFVLVKVDKGYRPKEVAKQINQQLGLQALTRSTFKWRNIEYYMDYTAIPANFGITILLGFIIGSAIAGQTFYIFVLENLRQFASLKAMGVTNRQLFKMVLVQASLVGFIGFSLGIGACTVFLELTAETAALRGVFLIMPVIAGVGVAIIIIMIFASYFSIRKVFHVAPADVFKG